MRLGAVAVQIRKAGDVPVGPAGHARDREAIGRRDRTVVEKPDFSDRGTCYDNIELTALVKVRGAAHRPSRRNDERAVFSDHVTGVVDDVGVIGGAADHRVRAGAAVEIVVAGEPFSVSLPPRPLSVSSSTPPLSVPPPVPVRLTGKSRLPGLKSAVVSALPPLSSMAKLAMPSPLVSPSRTVTLRAPS
jgi:hypothetical protein